MRVAEYYVLDREILADRRVIKTKGEAFDVKGDQADMVVVKVITEKKTPVEVG